MSCNKSTWEIHVIRIPIESSSCTNCVCPHINVLNVFWEKCPTFGIQMSSNYYLVNLLRNWHWCSECIFMKYQLYHLLEKYECVHTEHWSITQKKRSTCHDIEEQWLFTSGKFLLVLACFILLSQCQYLIYNML